MGVLLHDFLSDDKKTLLLEESTRTSKSMSASPRSRRFLLCLTGIALFLFFLLIFTAVVVLFQSWFQIYFFQSVSVPVTDDDAVAPVDAPDDSIILHRTVSDSFCRLVPPEHRFDCFPQQDATEMMCESRGCCWVPGAEMTANRNGRKRSVQLGPPACYFPFDYASYNLVNYTSTANGFEGIIKRDEKAKDAYPDAVRQLRLQVFMETTSRLHVKLTDLDRPRYEVPLPVLPPPPSTSPSETLYDFQISKSPFSFRVYRKATGILLFDTSAGNLAFYDQFLEISSYLPSPYVYGLGEHTQRNFVHSMEWTKLSFWTTDIFPDVDTPLYGVHPFYLNTEPDGKSNGVFLFNSNAMEVILQPAPAITYRTIGGVLDFYFFLGPSPDSVVEQYVDLVGKPMMPPYWALGFHLCRWGYKTLNETKAVNDLNVAAEIPLDVQWNDLDFMNGSKDFTVDSVNFAGLADFVTSLHDQGMRYVILEDSAISSVEPPGTYPPFDDALAMDCLVNNATGSYIEGMMWTGLKEAYPDFTCPRSTEYFSKLVAEFHGQVNFDGLWIDMNEPASFVNGSTHGCPDSSLESPPYTPQLAHPTLNGRTLCMTAQHHAGLHYNLHSLYGLYMAKTTHEALVALNPNKRPFSLSRSTFAGQGQYSFHWTGDISSDWEHLRSSVVDVLNFNLFGMPFVGADICGFTGDTTDELCLRWHQLGAFYPFSRNHNALGQRDQDPASFPEPIVTSIRRSLEIRYALLPYMQTTLYRASTNGRAVVRPLFFQHPADRVTYTIDSQFLFGSALLVNPVLTENTSQVLAYFPADRWYNLYTGEETVSRGEWILHDASLEQDMPVYVRGGSVIPSQIPDVTTMASRINWFTLIIALDASNAACGELFWDDGEQPLSNGNFTLIQFGLSNNELKSTIVADKFPVEPLLNFLVVYGMEKPTEVLVNGKSTAFSYGDEDVLKVDHVALDLTEPFSVQFKF